MSPESLSKKSLKSGQADFEIRFIWWALALAIFAGFALGAHVISVIGFNLSLGKTFYTYVQTHGHIQLVGWAGLFVIGISLHFIPRLAGVPIARPSWIVVSLRLVAVGLLLRFFTHAFLPYLSGAAFFWPANTLSAVSGILECSGILIYLLALTQTITGIEDIRQRPALMSVRPFFLMMFAGWLVYAVLNAALLIEMLIRASVALNQPWNEFAIGVFFNLTLLPVAFAFSIRMFPLYLRLPAIDWSVAGLALLYIAAVLMQMLPTLPPVAAWPTSLPVKISSLGGAFKGSIIVWFVWRLDLFTRRRAPWTVHRVLHPGPERRPTRAGIPDYGEFGRFEWLVYSAYAWLILAAVVEMALGLTTLLGWTLAISTDALRHMYLLGFVTLLILGMAPRMIPGFIKKKGVARPKLVATTFWLGNLAAVSRIGPLIIPAGWFELFPAMLLPVQGLLGLSGIFGLAAVICLAVNLRKTARS